MAHKYNAKKTVVDGIKFDSKKEAARYEVLKGLERVGKIDRLELQPRFEVQESSMWLILSTLIWSVVCGLSRM